MSDIDRSPTRLGSGLAIVAALLAVAVPGLYSWLTLGLGVAGVAVLAVGVFRGNHSAVTVGAGLLFVGVLVAGFDGAPDIAVLVGAVAALLAWDSASTAIDLGRQLGTDASTARIELVHVGATGIVAGGAVALAYSGYTLTDGGGSFTAVAFLLLAVLVIVATFR